MGTYVATKDSIERKWLVIDAEGMVLGRLATEVAKLLSTSLHTLLSLIPEIT